MYSVPSIHMANAEPCLQDLLCTKAIFLHLVFLFATVTNTVTECSHCSIETRATVNLLAIFIHSFEYMVGHS